MKLNYLLLISLFPIIFGCSKQLQKSTIAPEDLIVQSSEGKLTVISHSPYLRTLTYYYTPGKSPNLDSLKVNNTTYAQKTNLGSIILNFEQKNLEIYLNN